MKTRIIALALATAALFGGAVATVGAVASTTAQAAITKK